MAALFAKPFLSWIQRQRSAMGCAEKAIGGVLILFAVLIFTNSVNVIAQWMIDAIPGAGLLG